MSAGGDAGAAAADPGPAAGGRAAARAGSPRPLLALLLVLTALSGVIDGVCYLGLGHIFTANMTGNVVVTGFAVAGAPGFSIPASLTSLGLFLAGAAAGGRITGWLRRHSSQLTAALWAEAVLIAAAAGVAYAAATVAGGWGRYATIAVLAFAMGIRNCVVRAIAVPDMTTTVLTGTLTGLAADSRLGGGTSTRSWRRAWSVVAMFGGAAAGAALFRHVGPGLPLAIAAVAAGLAALTAHVSAPVTSYLDRSGT